MNIQIISDGCSHCRATAVAVENAAHAVDPNIKVIKLQDIANMIEMGVAQVPAVIIDGKIVSSGAHLSEDEAKQLIKKYL